MTISSWSIRRRTPRRNGGVFEVFRARSPDPLREVARKGRALRVLDSGHGGRFPLRRRGFLGVAVGLPAGLADIDASLEERAIFDAVREECENKLFFRSPLCLFRP